MYGILRYMYVVCSIEFYERTKASLCISKKKSKQTTVIATTMIVASLYST